MDEGKGKRRRRQRSVFTDEFKAETVKLELEENVEVLPASFPALDDQTSFETFVLRSSVPVADGPLWSQ